MNARMISSNPQVTYDLILVEMEATPSIHRCIILISDRYPTPLERPKQRYSKLVLLSSKPLSEHGENHCWYAEIQQWFKSHSISINALPYHCYSNYNLIQKSAPDQDIVKRLQQLQPCEPHRYPCHQQIKAVISRHCRCFLCFSDLSILDQPLHFKIELGSRILYIKGD